jgi:hypothetical protein
MHRRFQTARAVSLLTSALLLLTACSTNDPLGEVLGTVAIGGGGFSNTEVFGFGGLDLPALWTHMFGRAQEGDPDRECRDQHRCGVGGAVASFGSLTGDDGNFGIVTTGDFRCVSNDFDDCGDSTVTVLVSGVQTFAAPVTIQDQAQPTGATLIFSFSLLSARSSPAGASDSVVLVAAPNGGVATRVLKLTADDLGKSLTLRSGGCGTQGLPAGFGTETTYPTCSEWKEERVDFTDFLGQEVSLQIIAGEAGAAIALAFDDLRIDFEK